MCGRSPVIIQSGAPPLDGHLQHTERSGASATQTQTTAPPQLQRPSRLPAHALMLPASPTFVFFSVCSLTCSSISMRRGSDTWGPGRGGTSGSGPGAAQGLERTSTTSRWHAAQCASLQPPLSQASCCLPSQAQPTGRRSCPAQPTFSCICPRRAAMMIMSSIARALSGFTRLMRATAHRWPGCSGGLQVRAQPGCWTCAQRRLRIATGCTAPPFTGMRHWRCGMPSPVRSAAIAAAMNHTPPAHVGRGPRAA